MSSRPITKNILSYIESHLDNVLSLEKIAEELNYSRFYIARVFKEDTGLTLYQYVRSRRLNESARKLVETKLPVIEIAFSAGYHSQQAFTQAFHREYECTPQEYRRIGVFVPRRDKIEMRESGKCSLRAFCPAGGEMAA
ncbi:MAG: AraC family transcriptional regulator [Lachnospiraceae bacterium]|nr:AraC family transcriptional regulator [Lachnospiraceae bacterium]